MPGPPPSSPRTATLTCPGCPPTPYELRQRARFMVVARHRPAWLVRADPEIYDRIVHACSPECSSGCRYSERLRMLAAPSSHQGKESSCPRPDCSSAPTRMDFSSRNRRFDLPLLVSYSRAVVPQSAIVVAKKRRMQPSPLIAELRLRMLAAQRRTDERIAEIRARAAMETAGPVR